MMSRNYAGPSKCHALPTKRGFLKTGVTELGKSIPPPPHSLNKAFMHPRAPLRAFWSRRVGRRSASKDCVAGDTN